VRQELRDAEQNRQPGDDADEADVCPPRR